MKQNVIVFLLAILTYANTYAQPRLIGQRTIGTTGTEGLTSLGLTSDSGFIAGGTFGSYGDYKYYVVKLTHGLEVEWQKYYGYGNSSAKAIQQTADGGYIVGGNSNSGMNSDKTSDSRGFKDYWIIKLDAAGNIQWDKTIGGTGYDYLTALQQTTDGGYLLGGYSNSNKSFEKTEDTGDDYDYWVVKLDAAGNIQWDKTIGGTSYDLLYSLQQTKDGGYILGGTSSSGISGEKTGDSRGGTDYWIVKIDANGKVLWDKTIGGNSSDDLRAIRQTYDGGYILGGTSVSGVSGEKTGGNRGLDDYWVVKVNASGNVEWDKTLGGDYFDRLSAVEQTTDGGYILGGTSDSDKSGDKTDDSRNQNNDEWIIKLDNTGIIQWQKSIGGNISDRCSSIKEYAPDRYIVGGSSRSDSTGNKKQDNYGTSFDYWIYKLVYEKPDSAVITTSVPATSKRKAATDNVFTVFPNPAHEKLTIQSSGKSTFTLINAAGKIVATQTVNGSGVMQLAQLPAGVYYLKNVTKGAAQKIVITH